MKRLRAIRVAGLIVVFSLLGVGYMYFQQQSVLETGRARADMVIDDIASANHAAVKQQLYQINGVSEEQVEELSGLRRAVHNIDYVRTIYENDGSATFIDHFTEDRVSGRLYRAVYQIPDGHGGEDFVVVVFVRADDSWQLSDVVLTAVNPIL